MRRDEGREEPAMSVVAKIRFRPHVTTVISSTVQCNPLEETEVLRRSVSARCLKSKPSILQTLSQTSSWCYVVLIIHFDSKSLWMLLYVKKVLLI